STHFSRYLHSFPTRRSSDLQSATRLTEMASAAIAAAGMRAAPIPNTMPSLFSFTMPPQSAAGGWTPSPRKESADRNSTAKKNKEDRKSTRLNSSHVKISYAV